MRIKSQYRNQTAFRSTAGFTLLELTIAVAVLGIISAIAAPTWLNFVEHQRLNTCSKQSLPSDAGSKKQRHEG
jgi:prepilin-type N-terminal cleavage/methylation domain-containing protein